MNIIINRHQFPVGTKLQHVKDTVDPVLIIVKGYSWYCLENWADSPCTSKCLYKGECIVGDDNGAHCIEDYKPLENL